MWFLGLRRGNCLCRTGRFEMTPHRESLGMLMLLLLIFCWCRFCFFSLSAMLSISSSDCRKPRQHSMKTFILTTKTMDAWTHDSEPIPLSTPAVSAIYIQQTRGGDTRLVTQPLPDCDQPCLSFLCVTHGQRDVVAVNKKVGFTTSCLHPRKHRHDAP